MSEVSAVQIGWVHAVIDVPTALQPAAGEFWERGLDSPLGAPWTSHPEYRTFEPRSGDAYVVLQQIDGPPRIHIDFESEDRSGTVQLAVEYGADVVAERDGWTTLTSPGGLPFCVVPAREHDPAEPAVFDDGHRSRLVQVCIDLPAAVQAEEMTFWRALLPGGWSASDLPEFTGKWRHEDGSPIQLLFQQLAETDGPTRAHIDLGTDDLPAEVARLVALGAGDLGPGHGGWHVLRDIAGLPFCVTHNSPS